VFGGAGHEFGGEQIGVAGRMVTLQAAKASRAAGSSARNTPLPWASLAAWLAGRTSFPGSAFACRSRATATSFTGLSVHRVLKRAVTAGFAGRRASTVGRLGTRLLRLGCLG
jgi:hypothetical protein